MDLPHKNSYCRWKEISPASLPIWTPQLLKLSAPLFQLPYWTEPLRRIHFRPRYLAWEAPENDRAFVNILNAGVWPFRIGLIQRGPVPLDRSAGPTDHCLASLLQWARNRGYVFLRFTHSTAGLLDQIASLGSSERRDSFPFYSDTSEELLVTLKSNHDDQLAGFDREARRKIRNASGVPYHFEVTDSPDRLRQVWPLYQELAVRKGFFHRPLSSYLDLMNGARQHHAVRLYVVSLNQTPVNSLFLVNDATTAFYMSGALNVEALQGNPTPAPLLVFTAMTDAAQAGLKFFHFGTKSGKVHRFKSQFCPTEHLLPAPVTVVLNRPLYKCWTSGLLPMAPRIKARIKRLMADREETHE